MKYLAFIIIALLLFSCSSQKMSVSEPLSHHEDLTPIAADSVEVVDTVVVEIPEIEEEWLPLDSLPVVSYRKPDLSTFGNDIIINGKIVKDTVFSEKICFNKSENYSAVKGVTVFRGNNYRDNPVYGSLTIKEKKLVKCWSADAGKIDGWNGVGWTGQPAIIQWDDSVRAAMNLPDSVKSDTAFTEVICSTLGGKIRFLNLKTGDSTRADINIGFSMKGSVMIDPRGYPLLYQGMGLNVNGKKKKPFNYYIYNLLDQKRMYTIPGYNKFVHRGWGAFDSSALVNINTDNLILCGENAMIYRIKLNTEFSASRKKLSINPEPVMYRYTHSKYGKIGIESSPSIYRNFLYCTDNSGLLQCVDLNRMKPVWTAELLDDSDASISLEQTGDSVFIYTGNEVDHRGKKAYKQAKKKKGFNKKKYKYKDFCSLFKFNAMTGEKIWEKRLETVYNSYVNGGLLGSPLIGKKSISEMVFFNVARIHDGKNGMLIAVNKETGDEIWRIEFPVFSWSSPVAVYPENGGSYIICGTTGGYVYLIDAEKGVVVNKVDLKGAVESSPAVFNDYCVVGTKAGKIWCLRIK